MGDSAQRILPVLSESMGDLKLSLERVITIQFSGEPSTPTIVTRHGEKLQRAILLSALPLTTLCGGISIETRHISELRMGSAMVDLSGKWKTFQVTWVVDYDNGAQRTYVIDGEGKVSYSEGGGAHGKLESREDDIVRQIEGDGRLGRLSQKQNGQVLQVEHFDPAKLYPERPTAGGTGRRSH